MPAQHTRTETDTTTTNSVFNLQSDGASFIFNENARFADGGGTHFHSGQTGGGSHGNSNSRLPGTGVNTAFNDAHVTSNSHTINNNGEHSVNQTHSSFKTVGVPFEGNFVQHDNVNGTNTLLHDNTHHQDFNLI